MFININNLNIPQQEHARMAGLLALHWGNKNFKLPAFRIEDLIEGITFHHLGYGQNDSIRFDQLNDDELAEIFAADTNVTLISVEAELVNLFHHQRLINNRIKDSNSEKLIHTKKFIESAIANRLKQSDFKESDFIFANTITQLCDKIAFNFCLGQEVETTIAVHSNPKNLNTIDVTHSIKGKQIIVDPWPFKIAKIHGFIIGYTDDNYPDKLLPKLLEYEVRNSYL